MGAGKPGLINGLEISPPEEESDDEIAVRLVLKKDPLVNADSIRVRTRNSVVTLEGIASS